MADKYIDEILPDGSVLDSSRPAAEWRASLPANYRDAAMAALGELTLVSTDIFESGVRLLLDELERSTAGPLAVYCVRDVLKDERGRPLDYFDGPIQRVRRDEPGSDWRVAHFIYKSSHKGRLDHPSMDELRESHVRNIAFVDDISASGTNLGNFISAFHQNSKIKSWFSHGWISYHVILHTLGTQALSGVQRRFLANGCRQLTRRMPTLHCRREVDGSFSEASMKFFDASRSLLSKKERSKCMGFKKSVGRTIFSHGCPNNVPAIFWDSQGDFTPLFPMRQVPAELLPAFRGELPRGATSLGRGDLTPLHALALREIGFGARTIKALAGRTGLHLQGTRAIVELLRRLGLVDGDMRLTPDGKHALEVRASPAPIVPVASPDDFYYPRWRGGQ